tara:strand:- start:81 stop:590 length:510 start_codon:yes stop_codon:yes gene_type:complete
MKKNFYYHKRNPKFNEIELNKKGYPIWKDTQYPVHLYIAEGYILKRKLRDDEIVHHVDGDKLNFDFNNLIVLNKNDHRKIEQNIWKSKNLIIAYEIILFLVLAIFGANAQNPNLVGNLTIWGLLVLAMIIPYSPKLLRKSLFFFRIFQRNDRNRKHDIDYLWNKFIKGK